MARLLYSATTADGHPTEGQVNAPSAVAARELLERQGLRQVQLQLAAPVSQQPGPAADPELRQQQGLAAFKHQLRQVPTLRATLAAHARRGLPWLGAAAALFVYGLVQGQAGWLALALLCAAGPFVPLLWATGGAGREQRLMRQFALGNWDAVRVLAKGLRRAGIRTPAQDFDIDLRLAGIVARDQGLAIALARLEPWRARWATRPGVFEQGLAAVHHMAGDGAGYLAQVVRAHELAPDNLERRVDAALAQARFGSADQAEHLLAGSDLSVLAPGPAARTVWARGLVQLRRGQPDAAATLEDALAAWLKLSTRPEIWPELALCACDQAVALHQGGRHDAARAVVTAVWPVLEVHASAALLRMLEADDLLPVRSAPNT